MKELKSKRGGCDGGSSVGIVVPDPPVGGASIFSAAKHHWYVARKEYMASPSIPYQNDTNFKMSN